ncbi:tetratricopeptide repeat protein [Micromonospora sp. WMMA1923]|uniref:tetratricopeptide repeat protein n=1 Tax=Micromonospora sp. WMMA1923 TaxID=3404125 RepID=UPI003B944BF7
MGLDDRDELTVLVDRLRWDRRRDPYSGGRAYSRAAQDLAGHCEQLIHVGQSAVAVPVLRKAVDRMTTALMYLDSSSGVLGNDLAYLMDLYARACRDAPPRPKSLAAWLVKLAFDGPGWPDVRLPDWTPALGPAGIAEVSRLVDQRAAAGGSDGQQWAVRYLREQLAEVSGDVDRYVNVLAEHLVSAARYTLIARVLADADRPAEAIDWARRGLTHHPSGFQTADLRDQLVRLLIDTGDPDTAMAELWTAFHTQPTVDNLRKLLVTATDTHQDTPHTTGRALTALRERARQDPRYLPHLIDALTLTGHHDEAWHTGLPHLQDLSARQRTELLQSRQRTHPADVQAPYREAIDTQLLDSYDKRRYDRAITLLGNLRDAHIATGDTAPFTAYLDQLRVEHRRRPTFLAKLDTARLHSRTPGSSGHT